MASLTGNFSGRIPSLDPIAYIDYILHYLALQTLVLHQPIYFIRIEVVYRQRCTPLRTHYALNGAPQPQDIQRQKIRSMQTVVMDHYGMRADIEQKRVLVATDYPLDASDIGAISCIERPIIRDFGDFAVEYLDEKPHPRQVERFALVEILYDGLYALNIISVEHSDAAFGVDYLVVR